MIAMRIYVYWYAWKKKTITEKEVKKKSSNMHVAKVIW